MKVRLRLRRTFFFPFSLHPYTTPLAMKPSARIQASIEVLEKVANPRVPMDACVGDYMRTRRYIGSKDRAEIVERVYAIVRHYARLGWWVERTGLADTPRTAVLLWMALGEGAKVRRIRELCDATQHAPEEITEQERLALENIEGQGIDHPDMKLTVRMECPEALAGELQQCFGEGFEREMAGLMTPAPLDLRVNIFLKERGEVRKSLEKDGVKTQDTPYSPWGLRCVEKAYLSKTKAFNKGWVEIQDEGSQLIAALCEARPGMQVLDYCAGGGGKTLALASAMQRKGRIVAMDNDPKRLERGKARFKKPSYLTSSKCARYRTNATANGSSARTARSTWCCSTFRAQAQAHGGAIRICAGTPMDPALKSLRPCRPKLWRRHARPLNPAVGWSMPPARSCPGRTSGRSRAFSRAIRSLRSSRSTRRSAIRSCASRPRGTIRTGSSARS
jgi:hypothetical protein